MHEITLLALLQALCELDNGGTWAAKGSVVIFTATDDDVQITVQPDGLASLDGDGIDDSLSPETIALFELAVQVRNHLNPYREASNTKQ